MEASIATKSTAARTIVSDQQPLCHIVLYSFKSKDELEEGVIRMLALKTNCLRDGKPYVLDIHAGTTQPHAPVRTLGKQNSFDENVI